MKIHISMETKLLLDTLGRFHTEHRGLVDVKVDMMCVALRHSFAFLSQGKGRLDTYWLVGKEGGIGKWSDTEYEYSSEEGPAYMKDISEMPVKK